MLFDFPSVLLIVQNHAVSGMSTRKELAYPFRAKRKKERKLIKGVFFKVANKVLC